MRRRLEELSALDDGRLETLFKEVRDYELKLESGYRENDELPSFILEGLEEIAKEIKVLGHLADTNDWPTVIHLLKHFSRALYVRHMEEILQLRGAGGNGKGLWTSIMDTLFGTYAHQPSLELFTKPLPPPNQPNPALLECRGRRLLQVTESEKQAKLQSAFLKKWRDATSVFHARGLFKTDNIAISPSWLQTFSTNVDLSWTSMDGGVQRSLTGVNFPYLFRSVAQPPLVKKCNEMLKSPENLRLMAADILYVLMLVDDVFFSGSHRGSVVAPRPWPVQVATDEVCKLATHGYLEDFMSENVNFTDVAHAASTDAAVLKAFKDDSGLPRGEADALLVSRNDRVTVNGRRLWKNKEKGKYLYLKAVAQKK